MKIFILIFLLTRTAGSLHDATPHCKSVCSRVCFVEPMVHASKPGCRCRTFGRRSLCLAWSFLTCYEAQGDYWWPTMIHCEVTPRFNAFWTTQSRISSRGVKSLAPLSSPSEGAPPFLFPFSVSLSFLSLSFPSLFPPVFDDIAAPRDYIYGLCLPFLQSYESTFGCLRPVAAPWKLGRGLLQNPEHGAEKKQLTDSSLIFHFKLFWI